MTPKAKTERAALRQLIIDTADQEYNKKVAEWTILGMDENHPTVVEDTYKISERANRELKKLDAADAADENVDPNPPIKLSWLKE